MGKKGHFYIIMIFSHASPFYLAYRGQCLCYSGEFICAKHDTSKGGKKDKKVQGKYNLITTSAINFNKESCDYFHTDLLHH